MTFFLYLLLDCLSHLLRLDYKDKREVTSNNILRYLEHKEKFRYKFNRGWEHALVSGEEVYYIGIV